MERVCDDNSNFARKAAQNYLISADFRGHIIIRDVPDIRFRFRLAGYPAVFYYPVPVPVPAEMVPGTA